MRRRIELTVGLVLALALVARIPTEWKLWVAALAAVVLVVVGLVKVQPKRESDEDADREGGAFMERGPVSSGGATPSSGAAA